MNKKRQNSGLTFFEVMVTLTILSVGLLAIYKSFFISLNYTRHLNYRLYAINLLDEKIQTIEKDFIDTKALPSVTSHEMTTVEVDNKPIDYEYNINFQSVDGAQDLFELVVKISWLEQDKLITLTRSVYIANYRPIV